MESDELFARMPTRRLFFTAALPGAVSMLASALYDLLDGVLVGRILGETAFAAINLAMPFVILVFAVGDLFGVGSSVPIAISLGEGDRDKANNVFTCSVLMIVGFGALLGGGFWLAAPAIMEAMGATGELARHATSFLRVYALFSPINCLMFAVDNYLRICGRIRESLVLNLLMAGSGAVIEFSLLSFTTLGTTGAALGYCLAIALASVVGMWPFLRGRMMLRFVRPRFSRALVREVCAAGAPAFMNNVAGRVTSVLLNSALMRLGGEQAVSVYGLLMYVGGFAYPLMYGLADSLQPAVGYNWGARNVRRVISLEKHVFLATGIISWTISVACFAAPELFVRLFMGDMDEAFVALARRAFRLYAGAWLIYWLPTATTNFLTAINRARQATVMTLVSSLVAPVLALGVLGPLGLDGLWVNTPVSMGASSVIAVFMLWRLRSDLRAMA